MQRKPEGPCPIDHLKGPAKEALVYAVLTGLGAWALTTMFG